MARVVVLKGIVGRRGGVVLCHFVAMFRHWANLWPFGVVLGRFVAMFRQCANWWPFGVVLGRFVAMFRQWAILVPFGVVLGRFDALRKSFMWKAFMCEVVKGAKL